MARFEMIAGWPGGVLYSATHGRLYCVAPRGLVPDHPYTMAALRPPSVQEQRVWGAGVQPRMVVDVTGVADLHPSSVPASSVWRHGTPILCCGCPKGRS